VVDRIEFDWDSENKKHLSAHKVKPFEFEEVLHGDPLKQSERKVPVFTTEADEANWWYKNREVHGKQLLSAVNSRKAGTLTNAKLRERIAASKRTPAPVVSLRIPEADLALARKQAEMKGMPYQTYIKSLLHETLAQREKQKVQ
jgi:predicted DNA binding CopG/RHH family protein